jgi:hypothetical protein
VSEFDPFPTSRDIEFLQACGISIAPSNHPIERLPEMSGWEFWNRTHHHLFKYLTAGTLHLFNQGSKIPEWVAMSWYSSSKEAIDSLCLPNPEKPRKFVLVIDPRPITRIVGPRHVVLAVGVEFFLPQGIPREAVVATKVISGRRVL